MRIRTEAIVLAAILGVSVSAHPADAQAQIIIVNANAPGEGFNDPTPVAPVGGNPETTLGAQRLRAFQYAATLWSKRIRSRVPIRVKATFEPLTCDATSAILGAAGPQQAWKDLPELPEKDTWYYGSLVNHYVGRDLDDKVDEVQAKFNSAIGTTCAFPRPWYYGLDQGASPFESDLVTIVHHELCHGLGFITLIGEDGKKFNLSDDVYMKRLFDAQTSKAWSAMTDAERMASSINTTNLVWSGASVTAASGVLTDGKTDGRVRLYAPTTYQLGSSVSHFDTSLDPPDTMGPFYKVPNHIALLSDKALVDMGWPQAASVSTYMVASSAHLAGAGGAFFTTDVTISNRSSVAASITFKFLGNNRNGLLGDERTVTLEGSRTVTYTDILGSVFGLSADFGAIRITADSDALNIVAQTSTPGTSGGTFGQSVPAARPGDMIVAGPAKSITAIREDSRFRTNLILASASDVPMEVFLGLFSESGTSLGSRQMTFAPYEMRQISRVAQDLSGSSNVTNATLTIVTTTAGASLAAYASVIDNVTNDPRTLLPR